MFIDSLFCLLACLSFDFAGIQDKLIFHDDSHVAYS